jgi:type II secretory pathway predicted ATPase ExeA
MKGKGVTTKKKNPFSPKFGSRPHLFVGRDGIIEDFVQGLADSDDLHQNTIITGIRGSGKTAILSAVREMLDKNRYLVVDVTSRDGMLVSIIDECIHNGGKWLSDWTDGINSFAVGALGFSFGLTRKESTVTHGFRYAITKMLDELMKKNITTVFLIDEVHNKTQDMQEFAATYQHLVRENKDVALLMAGLPDAIHDMLNDRVLTFLRRAHRVYLKNINVELVKTAYADEFETGGMSFSAKALNEAAIATEGYPYLLQLLGYFIWKADKKRIDTNTVNRAVNYARMELFQNIHDLVFHSLSARDREFLVAMAKDERESRFGDLAARLNMRSGTASRYRQRLIDAGVIYSSSYGNLAFTLPFMHEYLQQQSR